MLKTRTEEGVIMEKLGKFVGGEENLILALAVNEPTDLDVWIGKTVRFKNEFTKDGDWVRKNGTLARDETYTVGGVQRIYDDSLALRIFIIQSDTYPYEDTFGSPARASEIEEVV